MKPAFLCLCLFFLPSVLSAEDHARFEFDVSLHDHSRLIGTIAGSELKINTQFGIHPIQLKVLRTVTFDKEAGNFVFLLRNDDQMAGHPTEASIILHSSIGDLTIPYDKILSIAITPPAKTGLQALRDGLVVHFTFDEQGGEQVVNQSNKAAPGKLVGGRREKGTLILDGSQDHVSLPNDPAFEDAMTFTVSVWTKLESFAPGGYANEHGYLVNKGDDLWWNPAWSLGYSKNSGANRGVDAGPNPALFTVGSTQSGRHAACRLASRTLLKAGEWYHLLGTYDGKATRLYLNGKLEAEKACEVKLRRDKAPLLLGGGKLGGTDFGNHFTTDATIENFRFYNRALQDGEVRLLHQSEKR